MNEVEYRTRRSQLADREVQVREAYKLAGYPKDSERTFLSVLEQIVVDRGELEKDRNA